MPLDAEQLKQQAVDELAAIETDIETLKGERKTLDEKIAAKENERKEAQRIVSALTPRAKRGEGKKAQAKKAQEMVPSPEPGPTEPGEPTVDQALQAQVPASGTTPTAPFIPPAS